MKLNKFIFIIRMIYLGPFKFESCPISNKNKCGLWNCYYYNKRLGCDEMMNLLNNEK